MAKVRSAGAYKAPPELIAAGGLPFLLASGARSINYLATVWPALLFGVLIAGLVRAFISPKEVSRLLAFGGVRKHLIGAVAGMPLMLCSCCIAPIFSSLQARGAGLAPSLAIMFSSPSLNVAALILTFLLFPQDIALARVATAILAVFVLPFAIERIAGGGACPKPGLGTACSADSVLWTPRHVILQWAVSSGTIAARTLPWIVLGVFASCLVVGSFGLSIPRAIPTSLTVVLTAFVATLIALPTFFEIPLGMLLLANGFPAGAVAAMLFAGPAINSPSIITLARVSSKTVAVLAFLGVWSTATVGGLLLQFWRV